MHDTYPGQEQVDEQGWTVQGVDPKISTAIERDGQSGRLETYGMGQVMRGMRPTEGTLTVIGTHPYLPNGYPVVGLLSCVLDERGRVPFNVPPEQGAQSYAVAFTGPVTPDALQGYMEGINRITVLGGSSQEIPYLHLPSDPNVPISMGTMDPATKVRTEMPFPDPMAGY